jgi:hypothetical protein
MARKSIVKKTRQLIYVFCEGESEAAYLEFLNDKFSDVAIFKRVINTNLFKTAQGYAKNDTKFRNNIDEIDEIWFFFDVEEKDISQWNQRYNIIKKLRRLKNKPNIKVRLLMTTGCIEYWLMLHYRKYCPPLQTKADKDRVLNDLKKKEPSYTKGDISSTARIALNYPTAIDNAKQIMANLKQDGLPSMEDTDARNQWLYEKGKTFSTVYEAILFLEQLTD